MAEASQVQMQPQNDLPKWTVMVFMGAATIEGNEPLLDAAAADLEEMRFVGSGPSWDSGTRQVRGELNIYVQVHQGPNVIPLRGKVLENMSGGIDALGPVPIDQRDPARGLALENFVQWAIMDAQHDPLNPKHYSMLVVWGHAYDFAIGREQTTDGLIDPLDFAELYRVLERLQLKFGAPEAKLDVLGFDACDLSTVEMAFQLEPFTRYLLASQIGIPLPGWPYDRILDRLRYSFGELMTPAEFGPYVVRRYCESYSTEQRTVSLTMLDLDRARELTKLIELLSLTLGSTVGDPDNRDRVLRLFLASQTAPGKPFVDLVDLCFNLMRSNNDALLTQVAKAVGDFLLSPRPPLVGDSDMGVGRPFIVEHGRNSCETARLNGVSVYAPSVAPERDFEGVRYLYQSFFFAQETRWSGLVHALAQMS
jgi:hypothetical protein